MAIANFVTGALVEIEGRKHTLLRQFEKGFWGVEDQLTGHIQQYSMQEMEKLYVNNKLIFFNDIDLSARVKKYPSVRDLGLPRMKAI